MMPPKLTILLCQTLLTIGVVSSHRICVFSVLPNSLSYRSGFNPLVKALIEKGHEVTLLSTFPYTNKSDSRVEYINPKSVEGHIEKFFEFISPLEWRIKGKPNVLWDAYPILTLDVCALILQSPEVKEWIAKAKKYDLFIVDSQWNECGIGLSHVFKSPLVLFNFHSNLYSWNLDAFGGAVETSWIPDVQFTGASVPATYFQRFFSTLKAIRWHIYRNSFTFFQTRKLFMKFLDLPEFPSIRDIEESARLFLTNSHFSEEYSRSLSSMFVTVGGMHIDEQSGYHDEQKEVVDKFLKNPSRQKDLKGFIFSNLGCSSDTLHNLNNNTLQAFLKAFEASRDFTNFVFVWNGVEKLGFRKVPENVLMMECTPEITSLLRHPNIKGFITHGDLLDVQDAIFHAVPLILLPVTLDQDTNSERVSRNGRGLRLEITDISTNDLKNAIGDLLNNEMFKTNMLEASKIFKDRQEKPLDTAVWWIEYILRNLNSKQLQLKPLGINQSWYVRRSLDIWMPIFVSVVIGICLLILTLVSVIKNYLAVGNHSSLESLEHRVKVSVRSSLVEKGSGNRKSSRSRGTKLD